MTNYEKLRALLAELFQFDQADLDFGIYRIMNQKRDEITRFLDTDLLPQVQKTLEAYKADVSTSGQAELNEAVKNAQALGIDPDTSPKVQELKAKLGPVTDIAVLEEEVFSHLYDFFRRYYHDGDFISLRRYKEGVYAIPYEGEEVKLYWANHDQYYVKSSENFRDYIFKLPDGRRVHFKIVDAETTKDNNRAANGNDRRFMLVEETPIAEEDEELLIRFVYEPDPQKCKQEAINTASARAILETPGIENWRETLETVLPTEKNPNRTLLEKHLDQYTRRNTFDYFIHKDLGKYLRRELDFYIKNELMYLDDIEEETAPKVEQYLGKIRALRKVAGKIITFLAQLEDFQKKLWLKKKFVVETNYCVTLDRVPKELYPEILANEAQIEEWRRLFAIDEIGGGLFAGGGLDEEFLKANPYLVVDTAHFDQEFKDRLLQSLDDIDEQMDGLLVHSENFQALSLLQSRLHGALSGVCSDPPYNTGNDGFPYKDRYQHSSWLSMMMDRLSLLRPMLSPQSALFLTIDYVEVSRLRLLCDLVFGEGNFLADIAWEKRYTRSNNAKLFYSLKDTVLAYRADDSLAVLREPRSDRSLGNYSNPDNDPRGPWISSSYVNPATKAQRPNLVYPIRNPFTGKMVEHPTHAWKYERSTNEAHVVDNRLYWGLTGEYEYPRLKSFLEDAREGMVPVDVWGYQDTGTTDDGGNEVKNLFGSAVFDNPKPPSLFSRAIQLLPRQAQAQILDYFAGSGTTAHAVINLNREDDGNRKYILVEMGAYFDTVLLPRIKKVIYSKDWRDGKPVSREGSSHLLKYIRLESYEDTLNNLALRRTPKQQQALELAPEAREEYVLSYMLDLEAQGSRSLLNLEAFRNPFSYTLEVSTGIVGETKTVNADLVETFNYLLGLRVTHIDMIRGVQVVEGWIGGGGGTGGNGKGERVLVLWRDVEQMDNDTLDEWFCRQGYNTRDLEYDIIYVNGDNNLENLRRVDQTWKVRLIEADFQRLMFDASDG